jgi:hypothetical protein
MLGQPEPVEPDAFRVSGEVAGVFEGLGSRRPLDDGSEVEDGERVGANGGARLFSLRLKPCEIWVYLRITTYYFQRSVANPTSI